MGMPVITPGTITREDAVGDIIESVSMEETALAHILNAESEKIMAVVNSTSSTAEQIMLVNESVKDAITAIASLEMTLMAKLNLFKKFICE